MSYSSELWRLVLHYQHHDRYTFAISLRLGTFPTCLDARDSLKYSLRTLEARWLWFGVSWSSPVCERVSPPRSQAGSHRDTVFTMTVGLAMAGLQPNAFLVSPPFLISVDLVQRSVVPTQPAVVRISGQPCSRLPRGHPSLHGSAVGSIS